LAVLNVNLLSFSFGGKNPADFPQRNYSQESHLKVLYKAMNTNQIPLELQKFFKTLENTRFLHPWNISKELEYTYDIDGEWEKKLIAERKLLTYSINDGILTTSFTTTDIGGKSISILFSKEEIDYFKTRIKNSSNKWLISKYAHIIWQETRHNDFAELALKNYSIIIEQFDKEEMHELPVMLSAIIHISQKSKKQKTEIKELVLELLEDKSSSLRYRNLKLAVDNKLFKRNELEEIAQTLPTWIIENLNAYFSNKDLLNLGLNIYHKLGLNNSILYELLAKNEHKLLDQHEEDSSFIKYQTNGTIAKYFALAGNKEESEKYFKEYTRLKKHVKLAKIRTELEDKEQDMFNEYLNKLSDVILESDPHAILSYFSIHSDVLVDPEEVKKTTEKNLTDSLSSLFTTTVFDINTNFKQLEDSDKFPNEWIKNYAISHAIKCEALFIKTFVNGIIRGKLNFFKIHEYLENHTWYKVKFHKGMSEEIDHQTNWITLLSPGIHNLFAQFEMSVLLNSNKINNFILAIDSLTLKFEGAVRDFILLSQGTTTKLKDGEHKEQLLEDLLNNPTIQEYFSDRDIELFKYTFTNKGRNIRNNVAHSFFQYSNYNLQTALLVFLCILRLGKYEIREKTSS
jgi:hypothetical protein